MSSCVHLKQIFISVFFFFLSLIMLFLTGRHLCSAFCELHLQALSRNLVIHLTLKILATLGARTPGRTTQNLSHKPIRQQLFPVHQIKSEVFQVRKNIQVYGIYRESSIQWFITSASLASIGSVLHMAQILQAQIFVISVRESIFKNHSHCEEDIFGRPQYYYAPSLTFR